MTRERFHQIVEAYGADPRRWPEQERAAAEAWVALHRTEAGAVLTEAAGIDAWLAGDTVDPPDAALHELIVASAPVRRPAAPRRRLWWSGATVAGAGLLGGLAGAFAVSFFVLTGTAEQVRDASYLTSSFGGSSADWSGE